METRLCTKARVASPPSFTPVRGGVLQRKCACGGTPGPTGVCEECRKKRESATLQRATAHPSSLSPHPSEIPPIVHEVLRSPGQPLDEQTRAFMEPRFGHDFSKVRVHTGARAAASARAVNAFAYTIGREVVFGERQYEPETKQGRQLLTHELTHVVQQSGTTFDPENLTIDKPDSGYEREAEVRNDSPSRVKIGGSVGAPVLQRASRPVIMRSSLPFSSTLDICHWLLKSRVFHVPDGGLSVTATAGWEPSPEWEGPERPDCGSDIYNVQLSKEGTFFDTHYPSREFTCGRPFTRTWGNLPDGDYYLTISTGNTNPTCCLRGNISVSQQSGQAGGSDDKTARKICGPDVTEWLTRQIETNAKSEVVGKMRKDNSEDSKGIDLGALDTWDSLVKTGAVWDFKKDLGDAINLSPCRQNCSGKVYSVTLDGQCMSYEAPANIHFGYVGRAAGFPEGLLLGAATIAQVLEFRWETKDADWDVEAIKYGFSLFNAGSPNGLNKSGLKANYYENLPTGDGDPAGCEPCPTTI